MAIKMDGNVITELRLHASNGTTETKQLTEELNLQTKTATTNGDVVADEGYDGLEKVIVAVSGDVPTLITKTITENGTYNASDDSADGYSSVTVNVSGGDAPKLVFSTDVDMKANEFLDYLKTKIGADYFCGERTTPPPESGYVFLGFEVFRSTSLMCRTTSSGTTSWVSFSNTYDVKIPAGTEFSYFVWGDIGAI